MWSSNFAPIEKVTFQELDIDMQISSVRYRTNEKMQELFIMSSIKHGVTILKLVQISVNFGERRIS